MRLFFGLLTVVGILLGGTAHAKEAEQLHVMTSLPLFWSEGGVGDILRGTSKPPPLIEALRAHYDVRPVDFLNADQLASARTLILAQPLALRPEEFVILDEWVRGGGRVMIFADPQLDWPSVLPLGDPRRPPRRSLLGPLFSHWGVRLIDGAVTNQARVAELWGHTVTVRSEGILEALSSQCRIIEGGIALTCDIGLGRASIVADADLLNSDAAIERKAPSHLAILAGLADLKRESPK